MDADASLPTLQDLLRHPDDLDKVPALKLEFARKKAAVDSQLKTHLQSQLQQTSAGMTSLKTSQETVAEIKEEMINIDRLCAEAAGLIADFPEINAVAQAHRNFAQVETTKTDLENFTQRLEEVDTLIRQDDEDLSVQPNLLPIHYEISRLRTIRDEALIQAKADPSLEADLQRWFGGLEPLIEDFDDHVGWACTRMIPLVQQDEDQISLLVRLAIVIEEEEKFDRRMQELRDAQREFKDLASRFKSLATTGPMELRGYEAKFLEAIKLYAKTQLDETDADFLDDPNKLDKLLKWYFNDLNAAKQGLAPLMPPKWKIFRTYVRIYHNLLCEYLSEKAADTSVQPAHMLAIVHYKETYHKKMTKLGVQPDSLTPPLPGGRDSDLVREYRQLIIDKVEEWMNNLNSQDRADFSVRKPEAIESDEHNRFRTKTLGDMWRLLREQLTVAGESGLAEVAEGVTDAMFRALKNRVDMWWSLINGELDRYAPGKQVDSFEAVPALHDWLIALANDQIVSISDAEANHGTTGYLWGFASDFASLCSSDYNNASDAKLETLRENITDLGFRCVHVFVGLIFYVDFRAIMAEFFTERWYGRSAMGQIITTFEDYLSDYQSVLHFLLKDLFVQELSDRLLHAYLSAIRNKGAKAILRPSNTGQGTTEFEDQVTDDVSTAFKFFTKFDNFDGPEGVKEKWRVISDVTQLIAVEKHVLPRAFRDFLQRYWDVKLTWVEALLRTREDIDWGPLGDGRTIMKNLRVEAAESRPGAEVGTQGTIFADIE